MSLVRFAPYLTCVVCDQATRLPASPIGTSGQLVVRKVGSEETTDAGSYPPAMTPGPSE